MVGNALLMLAVLVLPVATLVARRVPGRIVLRYGALWGAIFIIAWLIAARFT